jgi:hypothetical protein
VSLAVGHLPGHDHYGQPPAGSHVVWAVCSVVGWLPPSVGRAAPSLAPAPRSDGASIRSGGALSHAGSGERCSVPRIMSLSASE